MEKTKKVNPFVNKKNEECEGCNIGIGLSEEPHIQEYREHRLCSWCIQNWGQREKRAGREITFDEFHEGKLEKRKKEG